MSLPRSPDQAPTQSAPARARSLRMQLALWLVLLLTVYVTTDGWFDLIVVHHNADLVHFYALDMAIQMISGQIEWDEGRLRVSVPPATLAVFATSGTPVCDQVTYQVSTGHGRLLVGRLDFGTYPVFDAAGLADAGTYTDIMKGQPVRMAVVVHTMYDVGRTERVVMRAAQTMNGRNAVIRQLW